MKNQLYINYLNDQIYKLRDKALKTDSMSKKAYYMEIINNLLERKAEEEKLCV